MFHFSEVINWLDPPKLSKAKQTYRFLAVTTLIAVIASVFLPTSLAAAHYYCDAKYEKLSDTTNTFTECCLQSDKASKHDHYAVSYSDDSCSIEQVCKQSLTSVLSDTSVILPAAQHLFAALASSVSSLIPFQKYSFNPLAVDNAVPFPKPSLFLLNSVFLN